MSEVGTVPQRALSRRRIRARFLLLVIEPDAESQELLSTHLPQWQIDVIVTQDPADGLLQAGALLPDAVLTAAEVPPMRGSAIARTLIQRANIPTLVGVGECDGPEASLALAAGATACVARPYRVAEIVPILSAISPDTAAEFQAVLQVGALRLDPNAHEVHLRGERVHMPLREFELLHLLMLHAGRVVTRRQINQLVWSRGGGNSNTLSVHIRRIRKRLGEAAGAGPIIMSVRGMGYRLDPP